MKIMLLFLFCLSFSAGANDRFGEDFGVEEQLDKITSRGVEKAIIAEFTYRLQFFNKNKNDVDFFLNGFVKKSDKKYMKKHFKKVGFKGFSRVQFSKGMAFVKIDKNVMGIRPELMVKGQFYFNGKIVKIPYKNTAKETYQELRKVLLPLIRDKKKVSFLNKTYSLLVRDAYADDDDWGDEEETAIETKSREELFQADLSGTAALRLERGLGQTDNDVLPSDSVMASVLIFSLYFDQEHNLKHDTNELKRLKEATGKSKFDLEEGGGIYFSDLMLYSKDDQESSILHKNLATLNVRLKTLSDKCHNEKMIMEGTLPDFSLSEQNRVMPLLSEIVEHVEYGRDGPGRKGDINLVAPIRKSFYYFGYNNEKKKQNFNFCTEKVKIGYIEEIATSRPELTDLQKPIYEVNNMICDEYKRLHSCLIDYMSRDRRRDNGRTIKLQERSYQNLIDMRPILNATGR